MYCIDASVITNSEIEKEEFHEYSKKLMQRIKREGSVIILPEIVLPEIASALSRGTEDAEKALKFVKELRRLPNFVFVPIDSELADSASNLAAKYGLRGCDSIYAAVASLFGVRLITLDSEQRTKASKCIDTLTPQEELTSLGV